jgi:hypothetical protein
MTGYPILCRYTEDEVFAPVGRSKADCARRFAIGALYRLVEIEERSEASHRQQFAWLREAWANLPEPLADLYPTPEHLRKRALIEAGYYNEEIVDAGTKAAAQRVAAFVRQRDVFALVFVRGVNVIVRTAKSQSYRAMSKAEFQASKTAIMEIVAAMIGVAPHQLADNAERAA